MDVETKMVDEADFVNVEKKTSAILIQDVDNNLNSNFASKPKNQSESNSPKKRKSWNTTRIGIGRNINKGISAQEES